MKSLRRKRSSGLWLLTASFALVAGGVGIYLFAPTGLATGPTISHAIGSAVLPTTLSSVPVIDSSQTVSSSPEGKGSNTSQGVSSSVVGTSETTVGTKSQPSTKKVTTTTQRYISNGFPFSRPIHISIPAIGVSAPVSELGLNADGTVQVPTDFAVPGWYKYGQSPGQTGSAVILGHVDNYHGPAVFFYINRLKGGDHVVVNLADHRTVTFKVIGVDMYSKSNFPSALVYGPRHYPSLQLVTCGGVFDHQTGHYLSNIVVYTERI